MKPTEKPVDLDRVACAVCLKEVPVSEATVPEAVDYVAYFCGVDCFQKWKAQQAARDERQKEPLPQAGRSQA